MSLDPILLTSQASPFKMELCGLNINYINNQLITWVDCCDERYYFFYTPEGTVPQYSFDINNVADISIDKGIVEGAGESVTVYPRALGRSFIKVILNEGTMLTICTLTQAEAVKFYKTELWGCDRIILSESNISAENDCLMLTSILGKEQRMEIFPPVIERILLFEHENTEVEKDEKDIFDEYIFKLTNSLHRDNEILSAYRVRMFLNI